MQAISFQSAIVLLSMSFVGCQQQQTAGAPEEVRVESIIEMNYQRSLVTWILQGDSLLDGAALIDSGAVVTDDLDQLVGTSWVSEEIAFLSDTGRHTLELALTDFKAFNRRLMEIDTARSDFALDKPTHVAMASMSIEEETTNFKIPIRIYQGRTGIELEGKISAHREGIIGRGNWHTLHVGFLIYTDNIE